LIASPVVRTHPRGQSRPHGRRTVPRGVTRTSRGSSAESSAGTGSAQSRQAVSAATRYSLPHRGLPTVASNHASRSLARPFRAHRRATPACAGLHPPGLPSPTAHEESRIRLTCTLRRTSQALRPGRRCPTPATVRPQRFSRSRRFPPRNPGPGLFHPGNAPGVPPSGPCSSAGEPYLSRGRLLSCRFFRARGRSATRTDRGSRALIPPESPVLRKAETPSQPLPSWR